MGRLGYNETAAIANNVRILLVQSEIDCLSQMAVDLLIVMCT